MLKPNNLQLIDNPILSYSLFKDYALCHFTTTRVGGVSKGNYSEMNLSLFSNDRGEDVVENRKRLASGYPNFSRTKS